jgi:hypothetical protein
LLLDLGIILLHSLFKCKGKKQESHAESIENKILTSGDVSRLSAMKSDKTSLGTPSTNLQSINSISIRKIAPG